MYYLELSFSFMMYVDKNHVHDVSSGLAVEIVNLSTFNFNIVD
jgi:hypothetical protein